MTANHDTTRLYSDITDAVPSYALKTAATLRLADHIADGNRDTESLALAAEADPSALERLMRYLCCREIFTWSTEAGYRLTPFSRLLLDDHPAQLRRSLDLDGHAGRMDQAIAALPQAVRTGAPSYPALFGKDLYDDYSENPSDRDAFAALRQRQAHLYGQHLAELLVLAAPMHIVDVGGGTGALICALVSKNPSVTATVFDLPGLTRAASAFIHAAEVGDQVSFVGGDFFDHVPAADLHIISNTLFNWDDHRVEQILINCITASGTGRIIVVEHVLDDSPTEEELALDLRNLAVTGGLQRSIQQFDLLAHKVGLQIRAIVPLNYRAVQMVELSSHQTGYRGQQSRGHGLASNSPRS